ncbi:hypothetical protein ABKN59_002926 [Abortiporus biennis]
MLYTLIYPYTHIPTISITYSPQAFVFLQDLCIVAAVLACATCVILTLSRFIRGDKASSTPEAPLLVPTLQAQPFGCPWLLFDAPSSISDQKSSPSILGHSTIWLLPPELENSSLRPMGFVLHRHNGPLQTLNPPFHHMTTTLNKYPEPPFIHTISTST